MFRKNNSYGKKYQNTFVALKKSKTMMQKSNAGFEYDHDVETDKDYYQKIFESNCYHQNSNLPVKIAVMKQRVIFALFLLYNTIKTASISHNKENESPFGNFERTGEASTIGTTITNSLSARELEATLGKYACKKLGKKVRNKHGFVQEDFYLIKMKWLVKMAKLQDQTHKYNLNNFRLTIEKVS